MIRSLFASIGRGLKRSSRGRNSARRAAQWASVPPVAQAVFLAGVFCCFAVVGFVTDILDLGSSSPARLAWLVLSSGLIAVAYALCALKKPALMFVPVAVQVLLVIVVNTIFPSLPPPQSLDPSGMQLLRSRLVLDGVASIVATVASYALFVTFIMTEGQRSFLTHTEMKLAERIHRSIVPPVRGTASGLSYYGASFPSGHVGGDLVDFVCSPTAWVALVFDVSGHGVSSGVLTAMVKSAARMQLRTGTDVSGLLVDLNETLVPMIESNMFVTGICLRGSPDGSIAVAAAGHPPALIYRHATGVVEECQASGLALGIASDQAYPPRTLSLDAGDVLLLLTDGVLEGVR